MPFAIFDSQVRAITSRLKQWANLEYQQVTNGHQQFVRVNPNQPWLKGAISPVRLAAKHTMTIILIIYLTGTENIPLEYTPRPQVPPTPHEPSVSWKGSALVVSCVSQNNLPQISCGGYHYASFFMYTYILISFICIYIYMYNNNIYIYS